MLLQPGKQHLGAGTEMSHQLSGGFLAAEQLTDCLPSDIPHSLGNTTQPRAAIQKQGI